jgi:hypothetical protein
MLYLTIKNFIAGLKRNVRDNDIKNEIHLKQKKAGLSTIAWNPKHKIIIKAYYDFCVSEINHYLKKSKIKKNIIFGQYNHVFLNNYPVIKIDLQYEHTLIKTGARDSENAKKSKTTMLGMQKYLVRLAEEKRIQDADIVIDYSWPNYIHIKNSGHFIWLMNKYFVLSPMLYDYKKIKQMTTKRNLEIITLFSYPDRGRRSVFLDNLRKNKIKYKNINKCFENIEKIYSQTKILVNIHQTDEHLTFEELRVLPALLCGTIIISEHAPLTKYCGYEEFIIWGSIDEIPGLVTKVQQNYDKYWNEIFNGKNFFKKMSVLKNKNKKTVLNLLKKIELGDEEITK